MNKPRNWNKKNIKKYVEIYIKSDVNRIISLNKKKLYKKQKNIVGINIRPQFPKKPHIIIDNTFNENIKKLEKDLRKKIKQVMNKKKY